MRQRWKRHPFQLSVIRAQLSARHLRDHRALTTDNRQLKRYSGQRGTGAILKYMRVV